MALSSFLEGRPTSLFALALLAGSYMIYYVVQQILTKQRHSKVIKANNCKPTPSYPHKDPIFGLDTFFENVAASKSGGLFQKFADRMVNLGNVHTHSQIYLGDPVIITIEPENVKTVLATRFKDFEIPPRRKVAAIPVFGHGIFTTDGKEWEDSRALLRPNFTRSHIGDLEVYEGHVGNMVARIPTGGETVDLQELFFMLTLDSATDFLFGTSTDVLGKSEHRVAGQKFAEAFDYCNGKLGLAARVGKLANIIPDKKYSEGVTYIHTYIGSYVRKALQQAGDEKPSGDKYVFLDELAKTGYGAKKIQDELMNILLAGRDTTASLLAHLFYELARRPNVWAKLRAEVLAVGSGTPSFEQIKGMKYLQWCLNETLRLYPVVPLNGRMAVADTMLPLGGGADGKSPIFVPCGTQITYCVWLMHRRKDIYGEDAEDFNPERWENLRPGWQYLPFNGGPRICIGQQFALTEASFTTIRLLQAFKSIENRDPAPYKPKLTFTLSIQGGCQVALTPA